MNQSSPVIARVASDEPIAIVGIGCRFPGGADGPEAYWNNLAAGRSAIREVPPDRWSIEEFYHPLPGTPGKSISKWGGFLEDIAGFEPEAFGISPREARYMDPQQRILLEVAWEAIEDAGWNVQALSGSDTGVFVGVSISDYGQVQGMSGLGQEVDAHSATGGALSIAANRVSYCLNLLGPSISVDTACSSSLVSVDLACRRIRQGDCSQALAGGINIMITPAPFVAFSAATMLAPDGRCKAFDAKADGFVRGEGGGLVLLKPLSRAEADGDPIYAVILASGSNQDGRTSGIALPNGASQAALVDSVCRQAGIAPGSIDYMEAHGTGTAVGDPIEAKALGEVIGRGRNDAPACLLGSVKANIGHLESGAGIAGLIKAVLVLDKGRVPPHPLASEPNPAIPFREMGLRLPMELEDLPDRGRPLLAAVNSFGFGGTNAHAVLQQYRAPAERRERAPGEAEPGLAILPLSARSEEGLAALAERYRAHLQQGQEALADICLTAALSRAGLDQRLALVGESKAEMTGLLDAFLAGEKRPGLAFGTRPRGQAPKLAFVFSGQGPQWWAMGRALLEQEPLFRQVVADCDRAMAELGDWSLLEELQRDEATSRLGETRFAQPALFALQAGLTALLSSWGIEPDAVMGHSVGEIAAAQAAGALSLEQAARVAFIRGDSMDRASSKGRMLAVGLSDEEARQAIAGKESLISIAAVNAPRSVTLSGQREALEEIARDLDVWDVFNRWLQVSYAFHSTQMDPVREVLLDRLHGLTGGASACTWISSVTAEPLAGQAVDGDYWWRNVREGVRFSAAFRCLLEEGCTAFLELSPHPVLAGSMLEALADEEREAAIVPSLRRGEPDGVALRRALGELWIAGLEMDWRRQAPPDTRSVRLPRYPWQRQVYWHESDEFKERRTGQATHPLLGRRERLAKPTWRQRLDCRVLTYLVDHQVNHLVVFPAAGFLEMMLAVATEVQASTPHIVEEVRFRTVLHLPTSDEGPLVEVAFSPDEGLAEIYSGSGNNDEWVLHASGYLRNGGPEAAPETLDLEALARRGEVEDAAGELYRLYETVGIHYGPAFQPVESLYRKPGEVIGKVRLPAGLSEGLDRYFVHPSLLDGCFQLIGGLLDPNALRRYLPVFVGQMRFFAKPGASCWGQVRLLRQTPEIMLVDLRLFDEEGKLCVAFDRFMLQETGAERAADIEGLFYRVAWYDSPLLSGRPSLALPAVPSVEEVRAEALKDEAPLLGVQGDEASLASLVGGYAHAHLDMDRLALAYIRDGLRALGLPLLPGDCFGQEDIDTLPVTEDLRRLLQRFIGHLTAVGQLVRDEQKEAWRVGDMLQEEDVSRLWRAQLLSHPSFIGELSLLGRCGSHLSAVLTGELDPVRLLFPEGSTTLAEQVYQDSPSFYLFNRAVAKVVELFLQQVPAGRHLRILEVGGGTGGLTSHVVPRLPAHRCSYVFTDISRIFFAPLERRLSRYDFLTFEALDIETDPLEQGFEAGSFDIVLASDVLHATRDLRECLGHIKTLLRPGGLFAVIEVERASPFMDAVFGLMKGWWRFRDHDLRPDYPLLDHKSWLGLLGEEGFEDLQVIASEGEAMQLVLWGRGPDKEGSVAEGPSSEPPLEAGTAPGCWLIFADEGSLGAALATALRSDGAECLVIRPGEAFDLADGQNCTLRPDRAEDYQLLLQAASDAETPLAGVVHLWALNGNGSQGVGLEQVRQVEELACISVLHCLQAIETSERPPSRYRFMLVTRGAQPIAGNADAAQILQGAVLGLGRVLCSELGNVQGTLLDLPADADAGYSDLVLAELLSEDPEEEVAIRQGARWCPRVEWDNKPEQPMSRLRPEERFRLASLQPGVLDRLAFVVEPRPSPGPGEIEVEVQAAALNFRDILKAIDLYSKDSPDVALLGDECAGIVTAVGEGVEDFAPGDAVVAFAAGSLGSHVTLPAAAAMPKAKGLSFQAAVTMPVAFLTAYYALHRIGRIQPGESVLIHSATGGVGLAALQVAEAAGAEIFATAGSPEKRDLLALYGIAEAMDSRALGFADEILARTDGRGVDLVLNALAGRAIAKGLASLAPYGRFLEIGKRDIYQDSQIGLWPFHKNISFSAIDLGDALAGQGGDLRGLVEDLSARIEAGAFRPLPYRLFPASRIAEAIRHMSQAKHVGKVVVALQDRRAGLRPPSETELRFDPDATYLITGGFGGMGLVLAEWILGCGGRNLVLVGRRGAVDEEGLEKLAALRAAGAQVMEAKVDVTAPEAVGQLIEEVRDQMPPLKGIFHTAMVLDDGALLQLSAERFRKVTAPKVAGAWNLHAATLQDPLEHFVLFSSMSSLVGQQGQANYAAANSFLDGFAHYRRAQGLPALVMNFGAIKDVGILTRTDRYQALAEHSGITSGQVLKALAVLTERGTVQRGVLRADWKALAAANPSGKVLRRVADLVADAGDQTAGEGGGALRKELLRSAEAERMPLLLDYLRELVGRVIGMSGSKIEEQQALNELGLDSLMALEMRMRIEGDLAISLPLAKLMQGPVTLTLLAETVMEQVLAGDGGAGEAPATLSTATVESAAPAGGGRLVALQPAGERSPLFCFPPGGGRLEIYRDFAESLAPELPLVGVEADPSATFESVEAMAAASLQLLLSRQPTGPYFLFGFSLGGFLALSTAELLEAEGKEVAFVGLADSKPSAGSDRRADFLENAVSELYGELKRFLGTDTSLSDDLPPEEARALSQELLGLPKEAAIDRLFAWVLEKAPANTASMPQDALRGQLTLLSHHVDLAGSYQPEAVKAPLFTWSSTKRSLGHDETDWQSFTGKRHLGQRFDVGHFELMRPPVVGEIAAQILGVVADGTDSQAEVAGSI